MSDIFLSYSSEDRERIDCLVSALEHCGWSVFWDRTIAPGKTWREVIGGELSIAHCVVVVWSGTSVNSTWVQNEADEALESNKLVPVSIDNVKPPLGFRHVQAANLVGWDGSAAAASFVQLKDAVSQVITPIQPVSKSQPVSTATPVSTPRRVTQATPAHRGKYSLLKGITALVLVVGLALSGVRLWDAMNQTPQYSDALPAEAAMSERRQEQGRLLDIFYRALEEGNIERASSILEQAFSVDPEWELLADARRSLANAETGMANQGQPDLEFGVHVRDLVPELSAELGIPGFRAGVFIENVIPASPAERAGLRPGDVVSRINGVLLESGSAQFRNMLVELRGQRLEITYNREGREIGTEVQF